MTLFENASRSFYAIFAFLAQEIGRLRTKPHKLLKVRWRLLRNWGGHEIYLLSRPRRLLKLARELFVGALRAGLVALILLTVIKLDLFPWLTSVARKLSPANMADIEDIKAREEEREATADVVIEKLRREFALRNELITGAVSASGNKIASGLLKLTDKQIADINRGYVEIVIPLSARFKQPPLIQATFKNLNYARPPDARNTLRTPRATCSNIDCIAKIGWNNRPVQNAVVSKLQLFWVATGLFPDDEAAQGSSYDEENDTAK